jgi:hypothetical protein
MTLLATLLQMSGKLDLSELNRLNVNDPWLRDTTGLMLRHAKAANPRDELDSTYLTGESLADAYWLMLAGNVVDGTRVDHSSISERHRGFLEVERNLLPRLEYRKYFHDDFLELLKGYAQAQFIHANRRFCVTENGYKGLVPALSEPGVSICIISGAYTPFVDREGQRSQHLLIVECCIYGIMDDEGA